MSVFEAIILGLVQGLTEFLPISSSGHLTLGEMIMGIKTDDNIALDVALHIATLLSIIVFFGKSWWVKLRENPKLMLFAALAGIPAILFYLLGAEHLINATKSSSLILGLMFISGGAFIMFATKNALDESGSSEVDTKSSLGIGLMQAVALMPGISRSGMTISAGVLAKKSRSFAFDFSFLCGAPLMAGAALIKARKIQEAAAGSVLPYFVGGVVAFSSGIVALILLRKVVMGGRFWLFGIYTAVLGLILLLRAILE